MNKLFIFAGTPYISIFCSAKCGNIHLLVYMILTRHLFILQSMLTSPHRFVLPDHQDNGRVTSNFRESYKNKTHNVCLVNFWRCIVGSYRAQKAGRELNSVSKIDLTSRLLFPGSFGLFHIFYWSWYLRSRLFWKILEYIMNFISYKMQSSKQFMKLVW